MSKDITCKLPEERAAIWQEVLGTDTVCIIWPKPGQARLPGLGMCLVYMLDLQTLDADQQSRLAEAISNKFDMALDVVVDLMNKEGVPILAEGCTVTVTGGAAAAMNFFGDWFDEHDDDPYDPEDDDGCWERSDADDSEDWRYDPNRCPMCGDWLDAEGNCSDMECGWSVSDDDDLEPDEDEEA